MKRNMDTGGHGPKTRRIETGATDGYTGFPDVQCRTAIKPQKSAQSYNVVPTINTRFDKCGPMRIGYRHGLVGADRAASNSTPDVRPGLWPSEIDDTTAIAA